LSFFGFANGRIEKQAGSKGMATETSRRRVKQTTSLEERIARRIEKLKARAEQLPTGPEREKE
jgi:hypothetical protein